MAPASFGSSSRTAEPGSSPSPAPAGAPAAPGAPATPLWDWTNVSSVVGAAPGTRSMAQAAYSPALGETVLFGGYTGEGGNYAYNDTWEFSGNQWTELFPSVSPSARWGGGLVYDAAVQGLILFGGRNDTSFFNDTWEYNASGWHNITTTAAAPSARAWFGMTNDTALGEVVMFGGMTGNVPAGTFGNWSYYGDTWTWANGTWTNITATAGRAPTAGEHMDGLTYDAADGYALLVGGSFRDGTCGGAGFSYYGGAWTFANGQWSAAASGSVAPPPGQGAVWFDSESNVTLYYEGVQDLSNASCPTTVSTLWEYAAGTWAPLNDSLLSPPPRILPVAVDDQADQEQVLFGGQVAAGYALYLNDTWVVALPAASGTVSFAETAGPGSAGWTVALGSTDLTGVQGRAVFHEPAGTYPYLVSGPSGYRVTGLAPAGSITVRNAPVDLSFQFVKGKTYTITFREKGLPSGETWCLVLVSEVCTTSSTRSFSGLTPGSYAYAFAPVAGQTLGVKLGGSTVALSGHLTVAHRSLTLVGTFTSRLAVEFRESGLPAGTYWSVKLGGAWKHSTTSDEIVFYVGAGDYKFKLGTERGYRPSVASGTIDVNGTGAAESIVFTPAPPHTDGAVSSLMTLAPASAVFRPSA